MNRNKADVSSHIWQLSNCNTHLSFFLPYLEPLLHLQCLELLHLSLSLDFWSSSKTSTTSFIFGRKFGSSETHWDASWATFSTLLFGYWPKIEGCKTWENLRMLIVLFACGANICSSDGLFLSIARLPDNISRRTTPKLYTSFFAVRWPCIRRNGVRCMYEKHNSHFLYTQIYTERESKDYIPVLIYSGAA